MADREIPTALITGGAKGIGRSIAEAVARSGWNIALCGRDREALSRFAVETERETGRPVKFEVVDLSTTGSGAPALAAATPEGRVADALICNAGDYGVLGPLAQVEFGAWKKSFDLNFFAVAELVGEYLKAVRASAPRGRKKIVILGGSGLGGAKVWPGISAYACAKAALYRLVEVVHEEVHSHGVDINCLAPGAVKTGITEQAVAAGVDAIGALHRASVDVRDHGGDSPVFVADAVVALLSSSCDGLSGRLISAKWDREILKDPAKTIDDPDLLRLRRIDDALFARKRT